MNIRHALILAVSIASLLSGCTTPRDEGRANEAHVEGLMRHRSWPRIEQIAKDEVKKRERLYRWPVDEKREKLSGWPDTAEYLPMEHKDKVWSVGAIWGTPNGDVERTVILAIGDDGAVGVYKRYWKGREEIPETYQSR